MNRRTAGVFACEQMLEKGETLERAEAAGPFVVALVELAQGGYQNRVAQPGVVLGGRRSNVPEVTVIATYGPSRYREAALRFNGLVDRELT